MAEHPPGPPSPPKCKGCGRQWADIAMRGHILGCEVGRENDAHTAVVTEVENRLREAIAARRQDRPFMERLAARLRQDANILDALASDDPGTP